MDISKIINELTLDEKIELLSGQNSFWTKNIERLNLKSLSFSDGPHGLRKTSEGSELSSFNLSDISICFPSSATSAMSFDEDVFYEIGNLIGKEARSKDVHVVLGPAINIQRNPLCGRHFEYVSEDPYLAGRFGFNYINGMQSNNVGTSVKHFACNNSENNRLFGNSYVDKRALFDIYLKPFKEAIKANPLTIMCSYNKFNGEFVSENKYLINDILREKLNFNNLVMTDWGAINYRDKSLEAGVDLEMPGSIKYNNKILKKAIKSGKVDSAKLESSLKRYFELYEKVSENKNIECSLEELHEESVKIATKSATLLKNNGMLPLNKNDEFIFVGELFKKVRYQGMGSSLINPFKIEQFDEILSENKINYKYFDGYKLNSELVDSKLKEEVLENIDENSKIILFIGLNDLLECEGLDRKNMKLPLNQLDLINEITKINKNVCVVLFCGSPVEMPFINNINSLLFMGLAGEGCAKATYKLLFNEVNPSGRLAYTFPLSENDIPFNGEFKNNKDIFYKESIYVGYRYYDSYNKKVLFPFGYGLSYSKIKYNSCEVSSDEENITINIELENTSNIDGFEVIEVFYGKKDSAYYREKKSLIYFKKVFVKAGSKVLINEKIPLSSLEIYNIERDEYEIEDGNYEIYIAKNVNEVVFEEKIIIKGSKFKNYMHEFEEYYKNDFSLINSKSFYKIYGSKIDLEPNKLSIYSPFKDFGKTNIIGRQIYKSMVKVMSKKKKDLDNLPEDEKDNALNSLQFTINQMDNFTLNALCNMTGTPLNKNMGKIIVKMCGHIKSRKS